MQTVFLDGLKDGSFMGRGVIDAPLEQVASYLHNFHNRHDYDRTLVQLEVCRQISDCDWLLYMAHEDVRCLMKIKRDFLYHMRAGYVSEKYVQSAISIEHPDYPHRPPYIRAEIKAGSGWVAEKYQGRESSTIVSYSANLDFKNVPPVLANRAIRLLPLQIGYLRRRQLKIQTLPVPPSLLTSSYNSKDDQISPDALFEEALPISHFIANIWTASSDANSDNETSIRSRDHYPWINKSSDHQQRDATISSTTNASTSLEPSYGDGGVTNDSRDLQHSTDEGSPKTMPSQEDDSHLINITNSNPSSRCAVDTGTSGTDNQDCTLLSSAESSSVNKGKNLCPNDTNDLTGTESATKEGITWPTTDIQVVTARNTQFPCFSSWSSQHSQQQQ